MIYTVAHIQDITERKKAEEIVRLSNIYNRSLIEASLDPLVTIGHDGKITDVNEATEKVTGYLRGELIDTDFTNYFTEPEKAEKGYQEVFKEGFVLNYELEIQHKSGKITPVLYNASIYKDEFGEIFGVFAAARDITERKRNEQELFNTKKHWEALLKALPVGISFSNDLTCQIITGNPLLLTQLENSLEDNLSPSAPNDEALGRQVRFFVGRYADRRGRASYAASRRREQVDSTHGPRGTSCLVDGVGLQKSLGHLSTTWRATLSTALP